MNRIRERVDEAIFLEVSYKQLRPGMRRLFPTQSLVSAKRTFALKRRLTDVQIRWSQTGIRHASRAIGWPCQQGVRFRYGLDIHPFADLYQSTIHNLGRSDWNRSGANQSGRCDLDSYAPQSGVESKA